MAELVAIPLEVDQVTNVRAQFVAAHGEAAWTFRMRGGSLLVPAAMEATIRAIDPDDASTATKARLLAFAADKRWRVETGGITVGGVPLSTDDRSKLMITGARIKADNDPDFTTPWVAADGSVSTVNAATIIAISDAVLAHVAACFAAYDGIKADIEAGSITTAAEIDAAGWPQG